MLNATRTKYDAYTQQIGKLNNVADPSRAFEVLPAIAQTLRAKLKGSSDFLSKINIISVVAQEGDKVGVGVKGTIASRTDTRTKARSPRYPGDLDETRYRCEKTDPVRDARRLGASAQFPDSAARRAQGRRASLRRGRLLESRDQGVDRSHDRQRGRPVHRRGRSAHAFRHSRGQAFG